MLKPYLLIMALIMIGCSEEPYVKQINKAHDFINQGKINNSTELLKEASEEYKKAYSYALFALEKQYDALFNLGLLHAYNGEFKHCIDVMAEAYEIRRDAPELFYYWGMCYANEAKISLDPQLQQDNVEQAEKIYQLGLALDPNNHQINYGLGILFGFISDDYERALEHLGVAYKVNPEDIHTLFALANLSYKLGVVEDSIKYFNNIISLTEPGTSSYEQAKSNLDKIR